MGVPSFPVLQRIATVLLLRGKYRMQNDDTVKENTVQSKYVRVGHIAVCEWHAHTRLHPVDASLV